MRFEHIKNIKSTAVFSIDNKYRYVLELTKTDMQKGKTVCAIMQNPSVANEEVADRSVQFLETLVFLDNYPQFKNVSTLIIVNQFALIQTRDFSGTSNVVGQDNDAHIREAIKRADIVLVAWGTSNNYTERKDTIKRMISSSTGKQVYQTKSHPSRGFHYDFIQPYCP